MAEHITPEARAMAIASHFRNEAGESWDHIHDLAPAIATAIREAAREAAIHAQILYSSLLMQGRPWAHTSGSHDNTTGMPLTANLDIFDDECGEMTLYCSGKPGVDPVVVTVKSVQETIDKVLQSNSAKGGVGNG